MQNSSKFSIAPVFILSLILVVFLAGCLEQDNDSFQTEIANSKVYGIATDTEGNPVSEVSISLMGTHFYDTTTEKDGTYAISEVYAGSYEFVAMKTEYDIRIVSGVVIPSGEAYEQNIVLRSIFYVNNSKNDSDIPVKNDSNTQGTAKMQGRVIDTKHIPQEGASVFLIGSSINYSQITDQDGEYSLTSILPGTYSMAVEKPGYKKVTSAETSLVSGHTYTWNFTIVKDCVYYTMNVSANYVVRYGRNETVYKGYSNYTVAYPDGASYIVYPAADGSLSVLSTTYRAGNRMLSWKLNNTAGRYSYVSGYLYVDLKGTQTLQLFDKRDVRISDAAASQSAFLGSQASNDEKARTMVDPYNSEIKAIAEQVKREAGSDNAWTVAKAMFAWFKNNTSYYHGPESDTYTQSAIEVLHSRRGDCDELSSLYISLLRAAGIPARFISGYKVEKNPSSYIGHQWVEFYDGEWVPVEVASSDNLIYENGVIRGESGNITNIINTRFGISLPDHVKTFVDDGTSQSMITESGRYLYYDKIPEFSSYIYYDSTEYDQRYIASCADGTRTLVKEKE